MSLRRSQALQRVPKSTSVPNRPEESRAPGPPPAVSGLRYSFANTEVAPSTQVQRVLSAPGRPLDEPLLQEMETRLGANFSTVRIHSDPAAERSATAVGARAYTSGEHIVASPGALDRRTIAHELIHVLQQRSGPVAGNDHGDGLRVSDPSDRFEREADANAQRAMAGPATTVLQRKPSAGGGRAPVMRSSGAYIIQRAKGHSRKDKKPRRRRASVAGIKRRIAALKLVKGHSGAGMWTRKVNVRGPKSFKKLPDRQILRHLSAQFFWYVKNRLNEEEQEFQAMYVNERIVVASNMDSSTFELAEKLINEFNSYIEGKIDRNPLRSILSRVQNQGDSRAENSAEKISKLIDPKNSRKPRKGAEHMVHRLQKSALANPIMKASGSSIGDLIKSTRGTGKIIFLTEAGDYHAEQKLVLALQRSEFDGKAHIYGKKRPCTLCSATLDYAVARGGMDIDFNRHPGGYWHTAAPGLVKLANMLGASADEFEKWLDDWGGKLGIKGMSKAVRMNSKGVKISDQAYDSASDNELGESGDESDSDMED
ncbi:eCIS core domain-containing protein [Streptomyces capitiformicae]|uniref:eCIS core domain-containing protein n=1 Tax=Streptomyces capitiformicae TaxID=2014920 RepID=A0A919GK15_9ACTN|nr:DUF4157 domain-containing protein [Streptomyces capitiformicae]GHH85428.1 hypothetical protein GCM10017771_18250 [Streptomyces capitiformicae]